MRYFISVGLTLLLVGLLCGVVRATELGENGKILLGRALAEGRGTVQLQLAVDPARIRQIQAWMRDRGAVVRYSDHPTGYIRADIPPKNLARVSEFPDGVEAVAIFTINQFDVELEAARPRTSGAPASDGLPMFDLHLAGAKYTGAPPMRADVFLREHKAYDGRGVTIGTIEAVDPLAPGLQLAYDLQGRPIRKVADFGVIDSPFERSENAGPLNQNNGWIDMRQQVTSSRRTISYRGKIYVVPYDGRFSIGTYHAGIGDDFSDAYVSLIKNQPTWFSVLWDRRTGNIWFDALHQQRFAGKPIQDYAEGGQNAALPVGFNATFARYALMGTSQWARIVVKPQPSIGFIKAFIVNASNHAIMVGSSAAGNGMMGGRLNGIAPGARLICVDMTAWSLPESFLWLAHHKADIVTSQFGLRFADPGAQLVLETILGRIAQRYGTVIVNAAGNDGPAMDSVISPSSANGVLAIGGYIAKQQSILDEGIDFEGQAIYSSRGPGANGEVKPDLLAPTQWLADADESDGKQLLAGKYRLPLEYGVGGGTSQATPTAAGAIALLISAARQSHISYSFDSVKKALISGARTVEGLPIDQGFGLIDVPNSWRFLKDAYGSPRVTLDREPMYGRNVAAGDSFTYAVDAISSAPVTVKTSWVGSPGTAISRDRFTLAPTVDPLVNLNLQPLQAGAIRSGLFELRRNDGLMLASWPITQIAPLTFDPKNGYSVALHDSLPHPGYRRYFIKVPQGASVLTVHLHERTDGKGWNQKAKKIVLAFNPLQIMQPNGFEPTAMSSFMQYPASVSGDWRVAISRPAAGTWQIILYGADAVKVIGGLAGSGKVPASPVDVTAKIYGVSLDGCAPAGAGKICRFTNKFAAFQTKIVKSPLAQHLNYPITVSPENPVGIISLPLYATDLSDVRAEFSGEDAERVARDLYYCPGRPQKTYPEGAWYQGSCQFRSHATGTDALVASQPAGNSSIDTSNAVNRGRWAVVVYSTEPAETSLSVSADFAVIRAGATPFTSVASIGEVPVGATFDVNVSLPNADPMVESPDVVARYRPLKTAYQWLNIDKIPIVNTLVPIWP